MRFSIKDPDQMKANIKPPLLKEKTHGKEGLHNTVMTKNFRPNNLKLSKTA
mgnify:CR=1 FL=1